MINSLERSQKHILLEQVNKANTSFIANINTVSTFLKDQTNLDNLSKVGTISTKVDELSTTVTGLNTTVTNHTGLISSLDSKVVSLTSRVGVNEGDIISLKSKDSALEGRIEALEAKSETIPTLDNYYTRSEVDELVEKKADATLVYTKDETEAKLLKKLDASTDVAKAGCFLKVGSDGNTVYVKDFTLNWGSIEGKIEDQTDLQDLVDTKVDASLLDNSTLDLQFYGESLGTIKYTASTATETTVNIPEIDYKKLTNKPKINNVVLEDNVTSEDLKLNSGIVLVGGTEIAFTASELPASAHWVGAA